MRGQSLPVIRANEKMRAVSFASHFDRLSINLGRAMKLVKMVMFVASVIIGAEIYDKLVDPLLVKLGVFEPI